MLARTLLLWFVLLAVPFQGYAAAAMACAHGVGQASMAAAHHGGDAKPPCHETAHEQAPGDDDGAQAGHKKCGNCAACSVGAAIAPACLDTAGDTFPRGPCPMGASPRIAACDPDLPERPPRSHLA
jgi:hypothetical protein